MLTCASFGSRFLLGPRINVALGLPSLIRYKAETWAILCTRNDSSSLSDTPPYILCKCDIDLGSVGLGSQQLATRPDKQQMKDFDGFPSFLFSSLSIMNFKWALQYNCGSLEQVSTLLKHKIYMYVCISFTQKTLP